MIPTGNGGTNGVRHENQKMICKEIYRRYQKARKKDKAKILDEYSRTLDYNRDYLAHILANWEKVRYSIVDGKSSQRSLLNNARSQ